MSPETCRLWLRQSWRYVKRSRGEICSFGRLEATVQTSKQRGIVGGEPRRLVGTDEYPLSALDGHSLLSVELGRHHVGILDKKSLQPNFGSWMGLVVDIVEQ